MHLYGSGWVKTRLGSLVLVAPLVVAATVASAHTFKATSTVTITRLSLKAGAAGRVKSSRAFCEAHRRIVLYRHVAGGNEPVARTRADSQGRWTIKGPLPEAFLRKYRAKAPRKSVVGGGHHHVCVGAKSDFVTY